MYLGPKIQDEVINVIAEKSERYITDDIKTTSFQYKTFQK
jgi:hypothetical protein